MKTNLVLQDIILNYVRREKVPVKIIISTGEIIEGLIHGFDNQTIIANRGEEQLLLYKANIVSIIAPQAILTDKKNI